jgi:acetyl esterase/lipase
VGVGGKSGKIQRGPTPHELPLINVIIGLKCRKIQTNALEWRGRIHFPSSPPIPNIPLTMSNYTQTPLPKPVVLPSGENITLPSRDPNRPIPCRVFQPENKAKGVFYHIHGGGWVLQSEAFQDTMLKYYADHTSLTVISVGYRLAPEHPYPAGNEDCFDVAEYLVDHAEKEFGAKLVVMGGDSAGGHLSVCTCFHLLESRPNFQFRGLVLNFGAYDLSGYLPQAWNYKAPGGTLVLDIEIMLKFIRALHPFS